MIIIVLFLIGFVLGLGYAFIGERLPLLVPEIFLKKKTLGFLIFSWGL